MYLKDRCVCFMTLGNFYRKGPLFFYPFYLFTHIFIGVFLKWDFCRVCTLLFIYLWIFCKDKYWDVSAQNIDLSLWQWWLLKWLFCLAGYSVQFWSRPQREMEPILLEGRQRASMSRHWGHSEYSDPLDWSLEYRVSTGVKSDWVLGKKRTTHWNWCHTLRDKLMQRLTQCSWGV